METEYKNGSYRIIMNQFKVSVRNYCLLSLFYEEMFPMLDNPAMYSGTDTMNGVWECFCQPYGGDIGG